MRICLRLACLALLALLLGAPPAPLAAQTASPQIALNAYRAPQSDTLQRWFGRAPANASRIAAYSYCGACTGDSDCGSGNKCCTGNCSGGKKKCYAVVTCP